MVDLLFEKQKLQQDLQTAQMEKLKRRQLELRKQVVREKCVQTQIAERTGYTNPAKLMNHIRAQKAARNGGYRDVPEYVSHI
jgi:hypothetical protein